MTVPVPLNAFDHAQAIGPRPARRRSGRFRLASLALTALFHAVAVIGLLAMVRVTPVRTVPVMTVRIDMEKSRPDSAAAPPPPALIRPPTVSVPLPVVPPVASAPALAVQPPATPPAPPAPLPSPQAGTGAAHQDFLARLLARLNRFKQYPRTARQARIQGVVMLHFVMDADGRLLSADIARSSGRPVLDQEALALIRRAQPLPPLPAGFPTRTLDAVVPVEFSLNG